MTCFARQTVLCVSHVFLLWLCVSERGDLFCVVCVCVCPKCTKFVYDLDPELFQKCAGM